MKLIKKIGLLLGGFALACSTGSAFLNAPVKAADSGITAPTREIKQNRTIEPLLAERLPVTIDRTGYNTLEDAVEAAESGQTLQINSSFEVQSVIQIDKDLTFQFVNDSIITFNGNYRITTNESHTITFVGTGASSGIVGHMSNASYNLISLSGNVTLLNLTIENEGSSTTISATGSLTAARCYIKNTGTGTALKMSNGTCCLDVSARVISNNDIGIKANQSTIKSLSGSKVDGGKYGISLENNAYAYLSGKPDISGGTAGIFVDLYVNYDSTIYAYAIVDTFKNYLDSDDTITVACGGSSVENGRVVVHEDINECISVISWHSHSFVHDDNYDIVATPNTFSFTANCTNCSITDAPTQITYGVSLSLYIKCDTGYELPNQIEITSNGVTLDTSGANQGYSYYNGTGHISILSTGVKGDIVVTVVANLEGTRTADYFVSHYMYMSKNEEGQCLTYFDDAKTYFNSMQYSAVVLLLTNEKYADAKARLLSWAAYNGYHLNDNNKLVADSSSSSVFNLATSEYVVGIAVVSLSVLSLAALLILRKKTLTK